MAAGAVLNIDRIGMERKLACIRISAILLFLAGCSVPGLLLNDQHFVESMTGKIYTEIHPDYQNKISRSSLLGIRQL